MNPCSKEQDCRLTSKQRKQQTKKSRLFRVHGGDSEIKNLNYNWLESIA